MTDKSNDDRFYFSPDVGRLVCRGDFLYTEYGEVLPINALVRLLMVGDRTPRFENYADWGEEHRVAVHKACQAEARKAEAAKAEQRAQREVLVEQARVKLTAEEFDAVYDKGHEDGRS